MNNPNPDQSKQRQHKTWSSVAAGWARRHDMLRRCSAHVTARMLELADVASGDSVLDVASGSGEPAISAARRVGSKGQVLGTDLVEDMLVNARANAANAGLANIEFRCIDGEMLDFGEKSFDCATIRWGLMFMPDPVGALMRVHRSLRSGGRLSVTTWAEPARNPFVTLALEVMGKYREIPESPPGSPGIFALADKNKLTKTLETAGFLDVHCEEMPIITIEAETPKEYWETLYDLAGPISILFADMKKDQQNLFVEDFTTQVAGHSEGDKIGLSGMTWIAAGRKQ